MVINGVELQNIDIADADAAESYENALELIKNSAHYDSSAKRSDVIRQICESVFEMFDKLFGSGTAQKVFGKQVNMIICLNAVDELVTQVNELEKANAAELMALTDKYTVNRQQRRDKHKKKKQNYVNRKR